MKRLLHLFLLLALLSGCDKAVRNEATGYTQGTTYSVIYYTDGTDHQYQIDSLLLAFDRVLSTYQESSYISKWNRNEADDIAQPDMFKEVISQSIEIGNETNGAFDISVSPLMTYWFEQNWSSAEVDSARIDSILIHVGMHLVHFENGAFSKIDSLVELDVNAIAQGYSVDILSRYLEGQGVFTHRPTES